MRPEEFAATINLLLKLRLGPVEFQTHIDVLGALPGEHENYVSMRWLLIVCCQPLPVWRFQQSNGILEVLANQYATMT